MPDLLRPPDHEIPLADVRQRCDQGIVHAERPYSNVVSVRLRHARCAVVYLQSTAPIMVSKAEHAQLRIRMGRRELAGVRAIQYVDIQLSHSIGLPYPACRAARSERQVRVRAKFLREVHAIKAARNSSPFGISDQPLRYSLLRQPREIFFPRRFLPAL